MASSPTKQQQPRTPVRTGGGPSRIKNKRQAKVVEMIDGYESTVTLAAGLRNVLLVWTLPGLAFAVLGLLGSAGTGRSLSVENLRWLTAVQSGALLLNLVTVMSSIVWAVRTWANVRRLGKKARIGIWSLFLRHVWFLVAAVFFAVGAAVSESGRALFVLLAVGSGLFASLFVPFVVFEVVRMFWRTGSPPDGGLVQELPHYGVLWFASWLVYSTTAGAFGRPELGPSLVSSMTLVSGISCVVAAFTGARLVTDISRRQDERLRIIIAAVGPDAERDTAVTNNQIETAWVHSENLVRFDLH